MELLLIIRHYIPSEINDLDSFTPVPGTNSKEPTSPGSDQRGFVSLSHEILRINPVTGVAVLFLLWEVFFFFFLLFNFAIA